METLDSLIYFGNPVTQWLIALAYIIGSVIVARLVYRLFSKVLKKFTATTESKLDDIIVDSIEEPIALAFVLLGFYLGYSHLVFEGQGEIVDSIFQVVVLLDFT